MDFKDMLNKEKEEKIINYALEFAENITPKLIESAQQGYTGYNIDLENRNDTHILKNTEFIKNLELLLDGCKVEIKKDEFTNILFKTKFYKSKLIISWI